MAKLIIADKKMLDFVYEQSALGLNHKHIFFSLNISADTFYSLIKRDPAFSEALKKGDAKYREDTLRRIKEMQDKDDKNAVTCLALSLNRQEKIDGKYPLYSEETLEIMSSDDYSPRQKIVAVMKDNAQGRISTKVMNLVIESISKYASIINQEELNKLAESVANLEEKIKNK
jgi:hypothetical protein